jgi:hypothetical protein
VPQICPLIMARSDRPTLCYRAGCGWWNGSFEYCALVAMAETMQISAKLPIVIRIEQTKGIDTEQMARELNRASRIRPL